MTGVRVEGIDRYLPLEQRKMGASAVARAIGRSRITAWRLMNSGEIKSVIVGVRRNGESVRLTTDVWVGDYLKRLNPELNR